MLGGGLAASDRASATQSQEDFMIISAIDEAAAVVGENVFEVVVVDAVDNPVEDGEVTAQLSMPSMSMPTTPFRVNLEPVGGGWYRGSGRLTMAGRWDVTIDVRRFGQKRGTSQIAIEASEATDGVRGKSRP
jgi:nitrogen fixation protein FixH